ncbi:MULTISPECIES: hypothetical protein [Actinokineospora]|uniref:Uncharacterized protein n=1 Tax=Actinokineospora fastidiosa TaxID=1816 RepID=A0A918GS29_9PSEU|nr:MULTISPECIES: hypothetical protein [Actinokineospora]UVS79157.1 hypothetical protein Actkin_02903 [Actinokineospora sp. UTMC 2448]GGS58333.1 hypothetical protein GCM10010171_61610 [Actinokineospora fastidiosa]
MTALSDYAALYRQGDWTIVRAVVERGDDTELDLRLEVTLDGARASLCFTGVTDLEFRAPSPWLALTLQIVDVSADGLEGVHYKVTDPDNGTASFWCAGFEIVRE